jgi:hypothetical protein
MKNKKDIDSIHPLVMDEEFWANSQFSIARYFGRVQIGDGVYIIVNKEGKDIFECSFEAEMAGREKAIEPGEPCDLCLAELVPVYRWLGRDELLKRIKDGVKASELLADYEKEHPHRKKAGRKAAKKSNTYERGC